MPSSITLAEKPVAVQGIGATGYSAIDLRRLVSAVAAQEGVLALLATTDFKITPGAGLTLASAAGEAIVQGDSVVQQGRYYQRDSAGQANITLATPPDVTNPRIDQVVLEIKDDIHDASGLNEGRIRVISGTPSVGATVDNRTGAAVLPNTCMRLADVLVPAGFAGPFVAGTHIRDRRPWARGINRLLKRNTGASSDDYTRTGGDAIVDGTNLAPRLECSGVPLEISWRGQASIDTAGASMAWGMRMDAATFDGGPEFTMLPTQANIPLGFNIEWELVPTPGSHSFAPYFRTGGAPIMRLWARAANPIQLALHEVVRQNADNS